VVSPVIFGDHSFPHSGFRGRSS